MKREHRVDQRSGSQEGKAQKWVEGPGGTGCRAARRSPTHCASPPPSPRWPHAPRARSPPTTAQLRRPRWPEVSGRGVGVQPAGQPPARSPRPALRVPAPHLGFGRPRAAEDAVVARGVGRKHVGQSGRGQQQRRQGPLRVREPQRRVDAPHRQQPCGMGGCGAPRSAAGLPAPSRRDAAWRDSRSFSSRTEELVAFTPSWMSVQLRNSAPAFLRRSFSCSKESKYLRGAGGNAGQGRAGGRGRTG